MASKPEQAPQPPPRPTLEEAENALARILVNLAKRKVRKSC